MNNTIAIGTGLLHSARAYSALPMAFATNGHNSVIQQLQIPRIMPLADTVHKKTGYQDMYHRRKTLLAIFALLLFATVHSPVYAAPMQETKVRLQSDLQKHIYRSLVDGAFHTLNSKTGEVRQLYPTISHPLILQMGDYYVMCADFRDSEGKDVDVDFYLVKKTKGFQVFRAEVDNHVLIVNMMKDGKARVFK